MTEPGQRVTLRYVPEFRCLAGDCKENCCAGLRVELSKPNLDRLVARAAGTPLEARVAGVVRLEPAATRTVRLHAYVEAGGKPCPFLAEDWLCEIHRTLGEETLADPCSLFPRVLTEIGGRRELSGTLACPETARLCLTGEDAVDVIPLAEDVMAREIVIRRHDDAATDPYVSQLEAVRGVAFELLRDPAIPANVGILLLADFAERIGGFFHHGTSTFDAGALAAAIAAIPSRRGAIEEIVARAPVADGRAVRAMKEMLVARLPNCDNDRFNALVRPLVLADPAAPNEAVVAYFQGGVAVAVSDDDLVARSVAAHARLSPELARRFDDYARRYTINSLMKDWYTSRPTLASSLLRLVVRLSLSRFLTLTDPELVALAPGVAAARDALDDAAVLAFQIVAKNVEHTPSFMEICENYLGAVELAGLEGQALLLQA